MLPSRHMRVRALNAAHRALSTSQAMAAKSVPLPINTYTTKPPSEGAKPLTRREVSALMNMDIQLKLYTIDTKYGVFHEGVSSVLDLGYVPGNWMEYTKARLIHLHGSEKDRIEDLLPKGCHILGFDVLFSSPPTGVSTMQGNIYSKMAHRNVLNHFQEVALTRMMDDSHNIPGEAPNSELPISYFAKEQVESTILNQVSALAADKPLAADRNGKGSGSHDIAGLTSSFSKLDMRDEAMKQRALSGIEFRPDVVLSDLTRPFTQQSGFYSLTHTRPHMRFNSVLSLSKPYTDSAKAGLDLAAAGLLLCAKTLRPGGTFVLRLSAVVLGDPEIELLHSRLGGVFDSVIPSFDYTDGELWRSAAPEVFFICRNKKDDANIDIDALFE